MLSAEDKRILNRFDDGFFKSKFIEFIEFKRAKGEKFPQTSLNYLKRLNNTLTGFNSNAFTRELATHICQKMSNEDGLIDKTYLSLLRGFSIFLSVSDPYVFVLPERFWATIPQRRRTFIFSLEEKDAVIAATDLYCAEIPQLHSVYGNICPYPVIVRILAGTGMRIGEVLSLEFKDIDFDNGIIRVIDGKGHISRLVPVSSSLKNVLIDYRDKKNVLGMSNGFLFSSPQKQNACYSQSTVRHLFDKVFKKAGIQKKCGEKPVIHTFRHTFCTHSLNRLIEQGMDEDNAVRLVAAYVGHVDIRDTYHYLHMTESAINDFNDKQEALFNLIPEVDEEDSYEW